MLQDCVGLPTGNAMRKVWVLLGSGMLAWGIGAAFVVPIHYSTTGQKLLIPLFGHRLSFFSAISYYSFIVAKKYFRDSVSLVGKNDLRDLVFRSINYLADGKLERPF